MIKMKAVVVHECGGPEAMVYEETTRPVPKAGEALIKVSAIGLNYIDVYHRTGLYSLPRPFIPGMEGAGVVEEVGPEVTGVNPGDRVVWAMQIGAYAEFAVVPAWKLVPIPAGVGDQAAAALILQGMTAHYLTTSVHQLKAGQTVLVHAAAGGAGLLLDQATPETLLASLQAMTPERFADLQQNLDRIPTAELVTEAAECRALVQALAQPEAVRFDGDRGAGAVLEADTLAR